MSRLKILAAQETSANYAALTDKAKTRLMRMFTPAITSDIRAMQTALRAADPTEKTYAQLTTAERNELTRIRTSMRATYSRQGG